MKQTLLFVWVFTLAFAFSAQGQVVGTWKTIDDETGDAKSHVQLYKKNGQLYGKIIKLLEAEPDATCDECPKSGKFKSRGDKLMGLHIIKGLEKDGSKWKGDDGIMDPDNGKIYDCWVWLDDDDPDELNVRGYLGWFYRTQKWYRVK